MFSLRNDMHFGNLDYLNSAYCNMIYLTGFTDNSDIDSVKLFYLLLL